MPRKGERKCRGCGDFFDAEAESFFTRDGELRCFGCYENAEAHSSTVVAIVPQAEAGDVDNETLQSEVTITRFDEDFTFWVEAGGDIHEADDEGFPEPIASQRWVSTDAWRGYTAFDLLEGFEAVESGWVTGYPDETTRRKADIGELFESIRTGELVPPVALYWVFGTTSNVFSTACDIVVRSEDRERLERWLEEIGNDVDELRHQLG